MHIEDISRAFLAMLEARRELVHDQAFNVGRRGGQRPRPATSPRWSATRCRVRGVAGRQRRPDLRNYRVDFSKLTGIFPDLRLRWSVREGIDELAAAYAKYGLTYEDFKVVAVCPAAGIRELLTEGVVDEMLRRTAQYREAGGNETNRQAG